MRPRLYRTRRSHCLQAGRDCPTAPNGDVQLQCTCDSAQCEALVSKRLRSYVSPILRSAHSWPGWLQGLEDEAVTVPCECAHS